MILLFMSRLFFPLYFLILFDIPKHWHWLLCTVLLLCKELHAYSNYLACKLLNLLPRPFFLFSILAVSRRIDAICNEKHCKEVEIRKLILEMKSFDQTLDSLKKEKQQLTDKSSSLDAKVSLCLSVLQIVHDKNTWSLLCAVYKIKIFS